MTHRPKYKAALLIYEWVSSRTGSKCYCLSDRTVAMLLTLTGTLYWKQRWEGYQDFTDTQLQEIFEWSSEVERELMNGCCGDGLEIPPIFGIDDFGDVIVSLDGGLTFEPAPYNDPRNVATQFQPLPLTGDEGKCAGAENLTVNVTDLVDQAIENMSLNGGIVALMAGILALVAVFITVASAGTAIAASAVIGGMVATLFGIGADGLAAAFGTEQYNAFKCLAYCIIGDNQTFDAAALDDLKAAVLEEFGAGAVTNTLTSIIDGLGPAGLTNMARLGPATGGDCEDCNCDGHWCWFADFTGSQAQGFENYNGTGTGTGFLGGSGWTAGVDVPNSIKYVQARRFFSETTISKVTYGYSLNPDDAGGNINNIQIRLFLDGTQVHAAGYEVASTETDATYTWEWEPVTCDMVQIGLECGAFEPYGTGAIHSAQFEGFGEPIEEPNCDEE